MKRISKIILAMVLISTAANAQMFWNHAAKFENGGYIACPNTLAINVVGSLTMEAWIYPATSTGVRYILFKGNVSSGYYLRLNSDGKLAMGTNGINRVISTASVPSGKWSHVAGTYNVNTDKFTLYIDGNEDGTVVSDNPPASNTDSLFIGKFSSSAFTGLIDEVRIWTKEQTSNDIRRNMRTSLSLSSGKYTSLLLSMPFQRINSAGTVFTLLDLSLNPISVNAGFNRGAADVNLSNAPSDYLSSNEALSLDADYDSYASIPHNTANDLAGPFTLEAWINIAGSSPVNQYIFHKRGNGPGIRFLVTGSQKLGFTINNSAVVEGSSVLQYYRWYHVAWVVSSSGNSSLYINGVLDSYFNNTGVPQTNTDSLFIGRGFNGLIDEVRLFKYERSITEINKTMGVSLDAANMPAGEGFCFNLDGSAWSNGGLQFIRLRGNAVFSANTVLNSSASPILRNDGTGFEEGFYRKFTYRRIPQNSGVGQMTDDSITIPDNTTISDLNVFVALSHGKTGEIQITLEGPQGQQVILMSGIDLKGGASCINTIFDDQADSTNGDGKYVHISPEIKPSGNINSTFQGLNAAGVWKIKVTDFAGPDGGILSSWGLQINNAQVIGVQNISSEVPKSFSLEQNYPNPFNPVTNIEFSLSKGSHTKIIIYDITGRKVAEPVNQNLRAGTYKVDFDASHLSSGTYFYRLETEGFTEVKKMILIK